MQFKGFKPEAMQRIAGTLGYQGDMNGFNTYLNQNPDKMSKMNMYQNKAMEMAKGGMVKKPNYAVGGVYEASVSNITDYGCFAQLEEGIEGLIHLSELDWTSKNIHPSKVVEMEQKTVSYTHLTLPTICSV